MKKIFSYALTIFMAFTMCANANAKSTKEIAFQMYSVRDLIGDPGKYAKNHEDVLKKLAAMGYTAIEATETASSMALLPSSSSLTSRPPE